MADIAVVIATRGAALRAPAAAASVLRSTHPAFELCVVDQREGKTPAALVEAARDPRARILTTQDRGLAAARNLGASATQAPLIAFTDDDCVVEPDWLTGLAAVFDANPRIGIVFGSIRAPEYDRATGLIQTYRVTRPWVACRLSGQWTINGIGGCMAVRRSMFEALQGLDERFGAGSPLRAAEDTDLVMRALNAGYCVGETPEAAVTHFGFHSWDEAPRLIEGYMFGLGAMHAKMFRLGGLGAIRPTLTLAWRWAAGYPAVNLNRRPPRWLRLTAFLRGVRAGWALPIDRATGRFAVADGPKTQAGGHC